MKSSLQCDVAFMVLGIVVFVTAPHRLWVLVPLFGYCCVRSMLRWSDGFPRLDVDPENKAVFITGCDSGFGLELAKEMDFYGFQVFAGCLYPQGEGSQLLRETCSPHLQVVDLDVTSDDSVTAAAKQVQNKLLENEGMLWAVVNNAGVLAAAEIELCSMEVLQRMMDINALGPVRVSKAFMPMLRESQGRLVIITSMLGRVVVHGLVGYCCSKYAAVGLAEGLLLELKKWGIQVISIEPDLYRTGLASTDQWISQFLQMWEAAPSDVQKSYGVEHREFFLNRIKDITAMGRSNIKEIVDCMMDAVTAFEPHFIYRRGFLMNMVNLAGSQLLPMTIAEIYRRWDKSNPWAYISSAGKKTSVQDKLLGGTL